MILIIFSTLTYFVLAVLAIILGGINLNSKNGKIIFLLFLIISFIYGGVIIYEKNQASLQEQKLEVQLNEAKIKIVEEQRNTYKKVAYLSLAILDLIKSPVYEKYPNFRLGLMWYWLQSNVQAEFHFKKSLELYPNNIPTKFNLMVVYALNKKYNLALQILESIPYNNKLVTNYREILKVWDTGLKNAIKTGYLNIKGINNWHLFRLPYIK
ncbi:MAG TPA: tetratricopeptide repeat protein [Ignavibacteria bacterium]|nr:tetratricopeptide repeat protein [Ignavibacteria bacterium]